jgi:hypothetical protein
MSDLGPRSDQANERASTTGYVPGDERLMNATEIAAALGLNPVTVRLWLRDGRVPGAAREGRQWLASLGAVRTLLAENPELGHLKPSRVPRRRTRALPARRDWSDAPEEASLDFAASFEATVEQ